MSQFFGDPVRVRIDRADEQLESWAVKIDALAARVDGAGGQIGMIYRHHVEGLKYDLDALRIMYYALEASLHPKRDEYLTYLAIAWNDLATSIDELPS